MVENEKPDLVIMGKQAIDDDCNQSGQMLAGLLGWPQGTFASKIEFANGTSAKWCARSMAGSRPCCSRKPAVVTTDLRLNEPRYASLPNIMKAKKKPIDETTPEALGVDIAPRLKVLAVAEPKGREAGIKVDSVAVADRQIEERGGSSLDGGPAAGRARQQDSGAGDRQGARRRARFGGEVDILVAGEDAAPSPKQAAKLAGVRKVLLAEGAASRAAPRRRDGAI